MDRLIEYLLYLDPLQVYGLVLVVLLACGIGVPIPEDITLIAGGVAAYYGLCNLWIMLAVALFGVLAGDAFIFFLGAKYGRRLTKKWVFHKLLPDERLEAVRVKMNTQGRKLLFLARFMPGFRAPVYFSAGTLHVPFRIFVLYDGAAALVSVPLWVLGVYYFGDYMNRFIQWAKKIEHGIAFVAFCAIGYMAFKWYRSTKVKTAA